MILVGVQKTSVMLPIYNQIVPEAFKGKQTSLKSEVECDSVEQAKKIFIFAKHNLLTPETWHDLTGKMSPTFNLTDSLGNEVFKLAEVGDYIKINLPGPNNNNGDGYDWVRIDKLVYDKDENIGEEYFGIRIRPADNPSSSNSEVAHFFEDSATGTYILIRQQNKVTAEYFGNNEVPNNSTDKITDNIRNTVVAGIGMIGMSEIQWKVFIDNLLKEE